MQIYQNQSRKPVADFVADFSKVSKQNGFVIHNEKSTAMASTFAHHQVPTDADFDLHMIQLCKPGKAAHSMNLNPERAAVMPKFVVAFSRNGATQVRFLHYPPEALDQLLNDSQFTESMTASCTEIISCIETSL